MRKKINIIDLFSGCGGFSLGAELAGCRTVISIDIDADLQSSYEKNFPKTNVINGDLSKFDDKSWFSILHDKIIDGVIGGPPCQGYSRMGRSESNDPRRSLLGHFFRNINIIKPKFFIMENVEGLLDNKNHSELHSALSIADPIYKIVGPFVIDASNLGAPTKRKRIIIIGYNSNYFEEMSDLDFIKSNNQYVCVKDAIFDLGTPIPQTQLANDFGWSTYKSIENLSEYAKIMRKPPPNGLGCEYAIEKLSLGMCSGNFETVHSDQVKARYRSIRPGYVDNVSRSKKLEWSGLSPTLRAGTGSDRGSYQAVRPLHPDEPRVITVREAARLQGFPDWFIFHTTKWHSFRMIGNSVSPLVSEHIVNTIIKKMKI